MSEGRPSISEREQDAAHFLIYAVHAYPGKVTVYAAGPLTDLALAQRIDSSFASTAKQLVVMGIDLAGDRQRRVHHESEPRIQSLVDPEAAHIVFNAPWPK